MNPKEAEEHDAFLGRGTPNAIQGAAKETLDALYNDAHSFLRRTADDPRTAFANGSCCLASRQRSGRASARGISDPATATRTRPKVGRVYIGRCCGRLSGYRSHRIAG